MFVMSLRYVCDVIAMSLQCVKLVEIVKLVNKYFRFLNYNFRKGLFYLGKCVCSQFYYQLSYNRHYL